MHGSRPTLLHVAATSLLFLVGACSASVEPVDESRAGAVVAACADYHAAHRDWFQRCEGRDLGKASVDALAQACAYHAGLPGMTVTADLLTGCAASIRVAGCGYLPPRCLTPEGFSLAHAAYPPQTRTWSVRTLPQGSVGPYYDYALFPRSEGSLSAGSPCDESDQCQSGVCGTWASQCGVCMQVVEDGEACSASVACRHAPCVDGTCGGGTQAVGQVCSFQGKGQMISNCTRAAYCRTSPYGPSQMSVCQPRIPPGGACDDLVAENSCVDGALCREGQCVAVAVAREGQPCNGDTVVCEEGIECAESRCRKPTTDVAAGGDCGVDRCGAGFFCDSTSRCAPRRALGAACAPQSLCSLDSMCSAGGTCGALPGEGETCNPGPELCAPGLICGSYSCVPLVGEGAACSEGFGCATPFACREGFCRKPSFCSTRSAP